MPREKILRDSDGKTLDLAQEEAEHANLDARAKRVILTDESGNPINSSNPLTVDTELTLDGNVIIDNISVFATDISDSSTTSFGLVDASGHQQIDVLTMPGVTITTLPDIDINDISKGTQTNDIKITLDGENVAVTGTFWQATQPISGTITANAGTNLNTSNLLTESIFTGRIGEVQANPTSNTILDRLKTIATNQLADGHNVTVDNVVGSGVFVQPGTIQGRSFSYEDTSFLTGESPRVLDINTDLGRNSVDGYFVNDGSGNIKIEISNNGTDYGGQHTLQKGEVIDLRNVDIDSIRLTWVANTAYRVFVI